MALLRRDGLPKGDALAVARIAGIAAAKRTPDLVPLCHPVALHGVSVELDLLDDGVEITATTRTADRTGVEMEALTSVVAAGLALYDMVKAVDRGARLTDVRLLEKSGGRSGDWSAGDAPREGRGDHLLEPLGAAASAPTTPARLLAESARGGRARGRVAADRPRRRRRRSGRRSRPGWPPARRWCSRPAAPGSRPPMSRPRRSRPLLDREIPGIAEALRSAARDRCRRRCSRAAWPARSGRRWS